MVMLTRSGVPRALAILTAILLGCADTAYGTRIDITDPTLLGPVLVRVDSGQREYDSSRISEVRFLDGIYSYVYRIQSGWNDAPGDSDPALLSFSITGHPLGQTWGAINSSSEFGQTNAVRSITPIYDGFFAVLEWPAPESSWTVVYTQSLLGPSTDGLLTYTSRNGETDWNTGEWVETDYTIRHRGIMLVPTPEPASFVLFGLGLVLVARRRAISLRLKN